MTNESTTQQTDQTQPASSDAWHDVGRQFEALGTSLATAFRTAWASEENRKRLQGMQAGLEAMVNEVGKAIRETSDSPEAQRARDEAHKAAQSIHTAGQQTWQEARPHLVAALRQVSAELQKAISQLEEGDKAGAPDAPSPPKAE